MKIPCTRYGVGEVDVSDCFLEERPDLLWVCSFCATEITERRNDNSLNSEEERVKLSHPSPYE